MSVGVNSAGRYGTTFSRSIITQMVATQNPAATQMEVSVPFALNSAQRRELLSGRFFRISVRRAPRLRDHNMVYLQFAIADLRLKTKSQIANRKSAILILSLVRVHNVLDQAM